MVETKLLVADLTIEYEGLVDIGDFFRLLDDWFKQNGYDKNELKHVERVREKGKFIDYQILPFKRLNDYAKSQIDVRVLVDNLTNTTIKKEKETIALNKGKITVLISAFMTTDHEEHWESKPVFFFFRTLMDKFVNKSQTEKYEHAVMADVQNLHTELKSYLNLSRHTLQS